jgi:thiamine pyrophosphokinase
MSDAATSRFAILLDGALAPTGRLRRQIEGCRVLAADGGIRHAGTLGRDPEMWLGDFDSVDGRSPRRFAHVPRESFPREKSVSDGRIAMEYALEKGARDRVRRRAGRQTQRPRVFNLAGAAPLAIDRPGIAIMLTSGREEAVPLFPASRCGRTGRKERCFRCSDSPP